jgi:thiosulfate reductase cytochrome b subunit
MKDTTKRTIVRSVHLIFALPLIGFIYGPSAEVEPYRPYFQYLYFPVVVLSGLWMWKGHVVRQLFSRTGKP